MINFINKCIKSHDIPFNITLPHVIFDEILMSELFPCNTEFTNKLPYLLNKHLYMQILESKYIVDDKINSLKNLLHEVIDTNKISNEIAIQLNNYIRSDLVVKYKYNNI